MDPDLRQGGTLQRTIPVVPWTAVLPNAGSAWEVDFSPDKNQTFMYNTDSGNEVLWIL